MNKLIILTLFLFSTCLNYAQTLIKARSAPGSYSIKKSDIKTEDSEIKSKEALNPYIKERRVALIIGNKSYKTLPLKNAVNDAMDMAALLSKKGFEVTLITDANKASMKNAIREFGNNINKGGVGLFYYSGHGIQFEGSNYLVPIDADVQNAAEIQDQCIGASAVSNYMEFANNRINIIILDACRNSPFRSFVRSGQQGMTKEEPIQPKGTKQGSLIAFATAPGFVASDGTERNGLYTSKLLKYINQPGMKLEDVFKKVRVEVASASLNKQVPWDNNSLTGDFYFTY